MGIQVWSGLSGGRGQAWAGAGAGTGGRGRERAGACGRARADFCSGQAWAGGLLRVGTGILALFQYEA